MPHRAPGPLRVERAWHTAAGLGIAEIVLLALAMTLVAVLVHPLQLALVRLPEGSWPRPFGALARWSRERQVEARCELERHDRLIEDGAEPTEAQIQSAGQAGAELRTRLPAEELCRPTALGNVLAAMETRAGQAYGFDAVVAWPRLHPVLGERTRAVVDDRRNTLDMAARLSVTMFVTGLAAVGLLAASGWWLLLALIPLTTSWIAYRGAVLAAIAYGESVDTAFDLHRFDLIVALHLPIPTDDTEKRAANTVLCERWRQGITTPTTYRHR
ncbi:MAG TPA: hypothetical protein VFX16_30865 [Pseudonocardiaceae bacterium]|nr:hypothetical protein [Pseudonocardiaceae bacterium]